MNRQKSSLSTTLHIETLIGTDSAVYESAQKSTLITTLHIQKLIGTDSAVYESAKKKVALTITLHIVGCV